MSNQKSLEYKKAMKALAVLAKKHRLSPTETERKLFWQGVLHGLKRGDDHHRARKKAPAQNPSAPLRQKQRDISAVRDSQVDSSVGAPKRSPDVNQGGVFKL